MSVAVLAPPASRRPYSRPRDLHERAQAREVEHELLVRYHRDGDVAAREELAERFIPLARDLALRYSYTDESVDDLFQVACLGLIKAIDRFDPDRGTKFTSYAAPTILGELKRHFRDKGWALHVPRDLQERALALSRETEIAVHAARPLAEGARGGRGDLVHRESAARGIRGRDHLRDQRRSTRRSRAGVEPSRAGGPSWCGGWRPSRWS